MISTYDSSQPSLMYWWEIPVTPNQVEINENSKLLYKQEADENIQEMSTIHVDSSQVVSNSDLLVC